MVEFASLHIFQNWIDFWFLNDIGILVNVWKCWECGITFGSSTSFDSMLHSLCVTEYIEEFMSLFLIVMLFLLKMLLSQWGWPRGGWKRFRADRETSWRGQWLFLYQCAHFRTGEWGQSICQHVLHYRRIGLERLPAIRWILRFEADLQIQRRHERCVGVDADIVAHREQCDRSRFIKHCRYNGW